jgi:hypothetical protein
VAIVIEFLDVSMKLTQFKNSEPTVKFIRNIDRAFDILNSRCPRAKGYKQPLRPKSKDTGRLSKINSRISTVTGWETRRKE